MAVPSMQSSLGQGNVTVQCTPGYDLWVTPGQPALSVWFYAGKCPAGGSVNCLSSVLPRGWSIQTEINGNQYFNYASGVTGAVCYQAVPSGSSAPGSGGSSSTAVELVVPPLFDLSVADGVTVSWLIGGVWLSAWAIKALRSALSVGDQPGTSED